MNTDNAINCAEEIKMSDVEDFDNVKLQNVARAFVAEMVLCRVNLLIEEMIKSPDSWDTQWHHDLFEQMDAAPEQEEDETDEEYEARCSEHTGERREPYEFYVVDRFFARKLEELGALITYEFDEPVWGRETTGQAIHLDSIVEDIVTTYKGMLTRFWEVE